MLHLDLFSGIGGFAYAVDQVFENVEHIFCENDKFCQKVLQKHWPDASIISDVREITPDTYRDRLQESGTEQQTDRNRQLPEITLLTGGFPCQPFSQAGKRGGTADNRYLWPEMLRVIQLTKPTWVIAENVRGLLTINEGMVFEQVCADLEREGYEVQPLIIPAVAVNAPHRRDRIWFIAHCASGGRTGWGSKKRGNAKRKLQSSKQGWHSAWGKSTGRGWQRNWVEVATKLCRMDDGISTELDELGGFTKSQHRVQRLKSLGNAIVPQVALEVLKGIRSTY